MNELSSYADGADRETSPTFSAEQVRTLLEGATKPTKIIAGARRGVFDIDTEEIENFFHLIHQRVREQSTCALEKFEANIYLNDGTSRRLSKIDDFKSYAQLKASFPTVISFHIVWLISFHDSPSPERQEIDIVIRASDSASDTIDLQVSEDGIRLASDRVQLSVSNPDERLGLITYSINHSRISWGLDIENHLRSHIDKIIQAPSSAERILAKVSGPLNMFTTLFVGLYLVNKVIDLLFFLLYSSETTDKPTSITELASNYLVNGHIAKYIVSSLMIAVVVMVIFSSVVDRLLKSLSMPRPSFIILTKQDQSRKAEKLKKHEKRWTKLGIVLLMNIAVILSIAVAEDRFVNLVSSFWNP